MRKEFEEGRFVRGFKSRSSIDDDFHRVSIIYLFFRVGITPVGLQYRCYFLTLPLLLARLEYRYVYSDGIGILRNEAISNLRQNHYYPAKKA